MSKNKYIYGLHAVTEALKEEKAIDKILLNKGMRNEAYEKIIQLAKARSVKISFVPASKFNQFKEINHQDVIAYISPIQYQEMEATIEAIIENKEKPLFLLLDGVTDVRNLGSIIRTAECTGVDAIILPINNSAALNEDAVKTSAGAIFKIPICKVNHIKDAIFYLQSSGIKVVAASEKANEYVYNSSIDESLGIVMGDEGKGISADVLKNVNKRIKLPILGSTESLNVAVACGAILYEVVRQRSFQS
ncbi:MAG: 23S rRNA (guanosine(2251)-2'-O)-methyltransferase RlmB [Bacteroidota bacterium]